MKNGVSLHVDTQGVFSNMSAGILTSNQPSCRRINNKLEILKTFVREFHEISSDFFLQYLRAHKVCAVLNPLGDVTRFQENRILKGFLPVRHFPICNLTQRSDGSGELPPRTNDL